MEPEEQVDGPGTAPQADERMPEVELVERPVAPGGVERAVVGVAVGVVAGLLAVLGVRRGRGA